MVCKRLWIVILWMMISAGKAENIDPELDGSKFAYGENVGWFNFDPSQGPAVTLRDGKVIGFVWQENIGWINLSPSDYGGVTYDNQWRLSGYAWSENQGWINFNPVVPGDDSRYGVVIDSQGNFTGWAWGENIGWIHFSSTKPVSYKVRACVVTLEDLVHFAQQWLLTGPGFWTADLNHDNLVDYDDFNIFSAGWLDFCPDNWLLKLNSCAD